MDPKLQPKLRTADVGRMEKDRLKRIGHIISRIIRWLSECKKLWVEVLII